MFWRFLLLAWTFSIFYPADSLYFAPSSLLGWRSANNYCRNICGSSLASFHDANDLISAQKLTTINTYIGLYYSVLNEEWQWSDQSEIDYSIVDLNATFNELSCILMNNMLEWEIKIGDECLVSSRFLCNDCDGSLEKYILIQEKAMSFDEADALCHDEYGTNLISIHSEEDYIQAKLLCLYGTHGMNDCWIGLDKTDGFVDRTGWTFGDNEALYPWANSDGIINNTKKCVALSATDAYLWRYSNCSEPKSILCAKPNELCSSYKWHKDVEESECEFAIVAEYESKTVINTKQQWMNSNGKLAIEYVFKTTQINVERGTAGVVLYVSPDSMCSYYYIGIAEEWYNKRLFIQKYDNGMQHELYSTAINGSGQSNAFYRLHIYYVNGSYFNIKLNEATFVSFIATMNISKSSMSGYIGLAVDNLMIHAKSLYISGSPFMINNNSDISMKQCESKRSNAETFTTSNPWQTIPFSPTTKPSKYHKICINVKFSVNESNNITKMENDVAIALRSLSCIQSMDTDSEAAVNAALVNGNAILYAEIFVCSDDTEQILSTYMESMNVNDYKILTAECGSNRDSFDSTVYVEDDNDDRWKSASLRNLYILIGVGLFVCCVFLLIGFVLYKSQEWQHHHLISESFDDRNDRHINYAMHITNEYEQQRKVTCYDYNTNSDDSAMDKMSSSTSNKVAIIRGNDIVYKACDELEIESKVTGFDLIPDPYPPPSATSISASDQVPSSLNTITAQSTTAQKRKQTKQRITIEPIQSDDQCTCTSSDVSISFNGYRVENSNLSDDSDLNEIVNMLRTANRPNEFVYDEDDVLNINC